MDKNTITVNNITINGELSYNGEKLLTYKIEYPEFSSPYFRMSIKILNMFYKVRALAYQKYCETELFKSAVEQYKTNIENDFPIRVYEAVMTYKVSYLESCIISLYNDKYEYTGGAHGNTKRESQSFNLQKYGMITLNQIIKCSPDSKTYILDNIKKQIEKDKSIYFDNYKALIEETFNKNSFYCTPQGVVVYYQQYAVAPYSSGIREFLLPYSECVINPQKLCYE